MTMRERLLLAGVIVGVIGFSAALFLALPKPHDHTGSCIFMATEVTCNFGGGEHFTQKIPAPAPQPKQYIWTKEEGKMLGLLGAYTQREKDRAEIARLTAELARLRANRALLEPYFRSGRLAIVEGR